MAKLTPSPSIVAPRGYECPGATFLRVLCSSGMRPSPDYQPPYRRGSAETRESTSVVDREDLGPLRPPSALRRRHGKEGVESADVVRRQREAARVGSHESRSTVFGSHQSLCRVALG